MQIPYEAVAYKEAISTEIFLNKKEYFLKPKNTYYIYIFNKKYFLSKEKKD